jgi:hypothetical protein
MDQQVQALAERTEIGSTQGAAADRQIADRVVAAELALVPSCRAPWDFHPEGMAPIERRTRVHGPRFAHLLQVSLARGPARFDSLILIRSPHDPTPRRHAVRSREFWDDNEIAACEKARKARRACCKRQHFPKKETVEYVRSLDIATNSVAANAPDQGLE